MGVLKMFQKSNPLPKNVGKQDTPQECSLLAANGEGLAEVRELVFRPPMTADDWKYKVEFKN